MTIPGIEQRCARCGVQIDDLAAHQERCFVVGDWVRWSCHGEWAEGEMLGRDHEDHLRIKISSSQLSWAASVGTVVVLSKNARRIPRPGLEVVKINTPVGVLTLKADPTLQPGEFRFEQPQPPAPTLYDGLTSTACLSRWRENRECAEYSIPLIHEMTPDQIAEAKRVYAVVAAGTWSEHLRRKVAASRSAERCQVVLDDDEALLAGCRSVE